MQNEIAWPSAAQEWIWDGKKLKYDTRTIFDYIDGGAELYLAYNFQELVVHRFVKPGQPSMVAELYCMGSAADAFGVFSYERQDEDAGIGQGSEFGGGYLRFWKGKYFISVYAEGEGAEVDHAVLELGKRLGEGITEKGSPPALIGCLPGPEYGLIEKNTRFLRHYVLLNQRFFIARENILKLTKDTEAVLAQYLLPLQKTHLLLIRYPNGGAAKEAHRSFQKFYMPEAKGKGEWKTEDRKWTLARRQEKFLCIVFGASQKADAEKLILAAEANLSARKP